MLHGEFLNEQAGKLAARVTARPVPNREHKSPRRFGWRLIDRRPMRKSAEGLELIDRLTTERGQTPARSVEILVPYGAEFE